jgi:uncharacterized membrane protein
LGKIAPYQKIRNSFLGKIGKEKVLTFLKMAYNNRAICIFLSAIGLLDSLYLSWMKISQNQALCIKGLGDCWSVNTSRYSELFGIPLAFIGAAVYVIILLILIFESRITLLTETSTYILFGISLFGTIYSFYLTYLEFVIIKAICPFCILSAVIITMLFIFTIVRILRTQDDKIAF